MKSPEIVFYVVLHSFGVFRCVSGGFACFGALFGVMVNHIPRPENNAGNAGKRPKQKAVALSPPPVFWPLLWLRNQYQSRPLL